MKLSEENNLSPLQKKKCPCGCKESFIPKRRNQIYKNSRHTNFAYNHGKRKLKSYGQKTAENQLRKNDKFLEKYYNLFENEVAIVFSLNLISDGFDHSFYIGHESKEDLIYHKSYNYLFHEYELDGRKLTRIIKQ